MQLPDDVPSEVRQGMATVSADFVDKIPMISRLLKEVRLNLDWIDSQDKEVVTETIGGMSGVLSGYEELDPHAGIGVTQASTARKQRHITQTFEVLVKLL